MTSAEPRYERDVNVPRLYWGEDPAPRGLFVSSVPELLGEHPLLTETWEDGAGSYVFLSGVDSVDVDLRTQVRRWLAANGDEPLPRLGYLSLDSGVRPVPASRDAEGAWRLDGFTAPMAGYQLGVRGGLGVAPGDHPSSGWGFVVAPDVVGPAALALFTPRALLPAVDGSVSLDPTGRWHFTITGAPDLPITTDWPDVFAQLDTGLRFFQVRDDAFEHVHFPVFRAAGPVPLHATLDPTDPLSPDRTYLDFFADPDAMGQTLPPIPTTYVDHVGHPLRLTAVTRAGLQPARLVFARSPTQTGQPETDAMYLTLAGSFRVDSEADGPADGESSAAWEHQLLCGLQGLEVLVLPRESAYLTFVPGQGAVAGQVDADGPPAVGGDSLSSQATTAWLRVDWSGSSIDLDASYGSAPAGGAPYSADPARGHGQGDAVLWPYEPVTQRLPRGDASHPAGRPVFPVAPFSGLDTSQVELATSLEWSAIAPTRRRRLTLAADPTAHTSGEDADTGGQLGVTPQGMAVMVDGKGDWVWVGIGHTGAAAASLPSLRFTQVTTGLKSALQTANLFLVLGAGGAFPGDGEFELGERALDRVDLLTGEHVVRPAVRQAVRDRLTGVSFGDGQALREAVRGVVADASMRVADDELDEYARAASTLTATIDGWSFELSPETWTKDTTFMIFKFVSGRSVAELAADLPAWTWPGASGADPVEAQKKVLAVIGEAAAQPSPSAYDHFNQIVNDPTWTGVLTLAPAVPFELLPTDVQPLAAGIVRERFRAHHFGITLTPYTAGQQFQPSSTFALVDYANPEDQYAVGNIAFAFRVRRLTLQVQNSAITSFTSEAQLLINRLFGSATRLVPTDTGNNLPITGAVKTYPGTMPSYSFGFAGDQTYQLDGGVLHDVEVIGAQLVRAQVPTARSIREAADDEDAGKVEAAFLLSGNLRFANLPEIDVFGWGLNAQGDDGYLRFGNLAVTMGFPITDPIDTTFGLDVSAVTFDLTASTKPRANSFPARFPARLAGVLATSDPDFEDPGPSAPMPGVFLGAAKTPPLPPTVPSDLGYTSISVPLQQQKLTQPWFGLDYVVDLGTLGAQAGSSAIAIHLLMAWSPTATGAPPVVYAGALLPGAGGKLAASLPLQGVLTLGFNSIELLVSEDPTKTDPITAEPERTYTLRLRDFGLKLLGLSLPPGQNDVIIFANPDQASPTKAGWYVAYAAAADPKKTPLPSSRPGVRGLQSLRRVRPGGGS